MRLLVGLGNPGGTYARNRHNIGFMAADEIVRRHDFSAWRSKFQGVIAEGMVDGVKLLVLKPDTFMNLSGQSVAAAAKFHKIALGDIFVLHDDLDLAPGKVRVKQGGGNGGHNGLKSIDAHLGPDYWRIRMGIGHPGHRDAVLSWVLGDFAKADEGWLTAVIGGVDKYLPVLLAGAPERFMTDVARDIPRVDGKNGEG
jgi:PTH1 family peptidyl-tRNA hydrolase